MVHWYLTSPEAIRPNHRLRRTSNFGPCTEYVDCRLDEGLENCAVLHWELRARCNELVRQDFDAVRPVWREGGLPPTGSVPACAGRSCRFSHAACTSYGLRLLAMITLRPIPFAADGGFSRAVRSGTRGALSWQRSFFLQGSRSGSPPFSAGAEPPAQGLQRVVGGANSDPIRSMPSSFSRFEMVV